ncbi:MAG: ferrous iron transport protein A [Gammaproteobacteria bacterium]|jgi:ferrous iron transport protein A
MPSLASLKAGQTGIVCGFTQHSASTQRLMQLGLIEGERIDVIRRAPAGDPIEIRVLGYSLSLRTSEAATILIDALEE